MAKPEKQEKQEKQPKPRAKSVRIVFPQDHKDKIAIVIRKTLMSCGLTEDQANWARTAGSQGMQGWIEWWIGHHTDYPETRKTNGTVLNSQILQGIGAWIFYKATVQVADKLGPTAADEGDGDGQS